MATRSVDPSKTIFEFPVIKDPDRKIAAALGLIEPVATSGKLLSLATWAVVIINPDSELVLSLHYPLCMDCNMTEIIRCVKALQISSLPEAPPPETRGSAVPPNAGDPVSPVSRGASPGLQCDRSPEDSSVAVSAPPAVPACERDLLPSGHSDLLCVEAFRDTPFACRVRPTRANGHPLDSDLVADTVLAFMNAFSATQGRCSIDRDGAIQLYAANAPISW